MRGLKIISILTVPFLFYPILHVPEVYKDWSALFLGLGILTISISLLYILTVKDFEPTYRENKTNHKENDKAEDDA